ncbi:MAG TPA: 4a-hydroxytetrahydrobiopterin dehydratase [Thermoanaerobaculia bacterium]|nr:4a-hydroxytetrahydrobiopterin dehydratase [Thermoanaerobaculia bacterium]
MRPPKLLSARTVQNHWASLPDWHAAGGNQELVGYFRLPDLSTAIMASATALILAKTWSGHARVESCGLEVVVHFTTPAVGGVTRTDLRLAERFSDPELGFARFADRSVALQEGR